MRAETFRAIEEVALSDPRVVVIASDPSPPFMKELAAKFPDRLMIEGISEQALVGMAAGLASEGYYPYIIIIAAFATRRCYEQLLLDFGLHELSGCMVGLGGGFSYAPLGPTHIAVDDLLLTTAIPGSTVVTPGDPTEAGSLIKQVRDRKGLSYFRVGSTTSAMVGLDAAVELGRARSSGNPGDVLFLSCGSTSLAALTAVGLLREDGISASVLHVHTVKPLDRGLVLNHVTGAKVVLCLEEHRTHGGLATSIADLLTNARPPIQLPYMTSIGVRDEFPRGYGNYSDLMSHYGLEPDALVCRALELLTAKAPACDSTVSTSGWNNASEGKQK